MLFTGNRSSFAAARSASEPDAHRAVLRRTGRDASPHQRETFNITVGATGTLQNIKPTVQSDPFLSDYDIVSCCSANRPRSARRTEQSHRVQQQQARLLQQLMVQLIASPISSRVGSVFERTIPGSSVSISPILSSDISVQQLNPTARITFGQRLSDRPTSRTRAR